MTVKSLLVTIGIDTSEFEHGMERAKNSTDDFKKVGLTMTAVGGVIVAALGVATKAAVDDEAAQDKLRAQMERIPGAGKNAADALINYAEKLQNSTGVEKDEIISAESILATFGLNAAQIAALTPRVLDMAAAHHKATGEALDLNGAAMSLGRAVTVNVSSLQRHGVALGEDTKATGDLKLILRDLDKQFGGSAEAAGQTFAGQLNIAKASLKDVTQQIGGALLPVILPFIQQVGGAAQKVGEWDSSHQGLLKTIVPIVAGFGAFLLVMGPIVTILPKIFSAVVSLGQGLIFLATNPISLVVAAAAVAVGIFFQLQNAIDAADQAEARYNEANEKLRDKLKQAADAAGMTQAEFAKLTEKYGDNNAAMAMAIEKGKEGKAIQDALVDVGKVHGAQMDKEREAYEKLHPPLKTYLDLQGDLNNTNKQTIDLQKELVAIRDALTEKIKTATSEEKAAESSAAQNEYQERLRLLGQSLTAEEGYIVQLKALAGQALTAKVASLNQEAEAARQTAQKEYDTEVQTNKDKLGAGAAFNAANALAKQALNTKLDAINKKFTTGQLQEERAFNVQIQTLEQQKVDQWMTTVQKYSEIQGMKNKITMTDVEFTKWSLDEEQRLQLLKIVNTKALTDKEKSDEIEALNAFYAAKKDLAEYDAGLELSIQQNLMSQTQTVFSNFATNTMTAFQAWGKGTGTILTALGSVFKSFAKDALAAVGNMVSGIISKTIELVAAKEIAAVASVIASVFASIPFPWNIAAAIGAGAAVSAMFGALHLAEGGIVTGPTFALIGEAGPEAVIPLSKAGKAGIGGGMQIHMTNHFHGDIKTDTDIDTFSAKMGLKIQQAIMRGRRGV